MGIDEIKLIIQALAGLADGAKEGFIWWLIIEGALPKILLAMFGAGFIGAVIYIAKMIIRYNSSSDSAAAGIRQISRIVGQNLYGSYLSPSEVHSVVDAVSKAILGKGASE
jgi:hypothetical protein